MSEHGKQGLRAFAYHPGAVPTELAYKMANAAHVILVDKVELSGAFTVWLTTPEAGFLKGRYSSANWDVDELLTMKDEIEKDNLLTCGVTRLF